MKNKYLPLILLCLFAPSAFSETTSIDIQKCKDISVDEKRLACYDNLFKAKEIVETDKAKEEFGLEHKDQDNSRQQDLVANVAALKADPYGKLKITLDNGQVWKQQGSKKMRLKVGDSVQISRGFFNSFNLRILDKSQVFKVKRLK